MKEASLTNMQLSKLSTDENNITSTSHNTHQQCTKDPLNPRINPHNIFKNNNISCMDEDSVPQHLSHNNILDAEMANEEQHMPNPINTPNPFNISSSTSCQNI